MKSKIHINLLFGDALLLFLVSGGCGQAKTSSGPANSPAVAVSNHLAAIATAGDPLQMGSLAAVLGDVGEHHGLDREALLDKMSGGTAAAAHSCSRQRCAQ